MISSSNTKMATAPPTGCYKCGRPGHWSRDCPSSSNTGADNPLANPKPTSSFNYPKQSFKSSAASGGSEVAGKSIEKPKKVPRTRPKLTPDLLLSDNGIGYILRYFPRHFRYRGHGHEVDDLGNLLELYNEWHLQLLPYYPFDQFVHKVEQVAATKRVKTCLRDLRERVANGGDPTKFHDVPVEDDIPANDQAGDTTHPGGDMFPETQNADDIQHNMLNNLYEKETEESLHLMRRDTAALGSISGSSSSGKTSNMVANNVAESTKNAELTEEQRARMEANRLKALEKRAAKERALLEA